MNSAGIPTDLGGYGILGGVVVAIGLVILTVNKYIKLMIAEAVAPLNVKISHMEADITKLQDGCKKSQACIIDAMLLTPDQHEERQKKLKEACAFLS